MPWPRDHPKQIRLVLDSNTSSYSVVVSLTLNTLMKTATGENMVRRVTQYVLHLLLFSRSESLACTALQIHEKSLIPFLKFLLFTVMALTSFILAGASHDHGRALLAVRRLAGDRAVEPQAGQILRSL